MKYTTEHLLAYLDGELSNTEEKKLLEALSNNATLHKEFDELRTVYEGLEESPIMEPSAQLSANFYEALALEEAKESKPFFRLIQYQSWVGKIAASIAIFCAGYFIDKQLTIADMQSATVIELKKEVEETKSLVMMAMLKNPSASSRIQAVQYSYDVKGADEKLLKALIHTMNFDQSINVKLAATEALAQFAHIEAVRAAMIQSLRTQEEPELQLLLIDLLVSLEASEALPTLRKLSQKKEILPIVKSKASQGVEVLL